MLEHILKFRVRYAETDQMGIVHHATYPIYYEMGRTELFRQLQLPYAQMEQQGVMLPLIELNCRYLKPAYYDEELTLTTRLRKMPSTRIRFDCEIRNARQECINVGHTELVFIDAQSRRPIRVPVEIKEKLEKYF